MREPEAWRRRPQGQRSFPVQGHQRDVFQRSAKPKCRMVGNERESSADHSQQQRVLDDRILAGRVSAWRKFSRLSNCQIGTGVKGGRRKRARSPCPSPGRSPIIAATDQAISLHICTRPAPRSSISGIRSQANSWPNKLCVASEIRISSGSADVWIRAARLTVSPQRS